MKTNKVTEIAILISLAVVLEVIFTGLGAFFPFLQLPYGGRISLSMLPLFIITFRHGLEEGVLAGMTYSLLNLMLDGVLYHWASLFLDYLFAFGGIGLAALLLKVMDKSILSFALVIFIGSMIRFLFSYLSGVVIFVMILGWMPSEFNNPWFYSLVYNAYYILPSMGLSLLVGILLYNRMKQANLLN